MNWVIIFLLVTANSLSVVVNGTKNKILRWLPTSLLLVAILLVTVFWKELHHCKFV